MRLTTRIRVIAFTGAVASVCAIAFVAGKVLDPDAGEASAGHGHGAAADDHAAAPTAHAASAASAAGVADGGLRLVPGTVEVPAGTPTRFSFQVVDAQGEPVRAYDVEHEAQMHLILARRDLTGYQHVHPELGADGRWSVGLELPEPGVYRAYADFSTGGQSFTLGMDVIVPGELRTEPFAPRQAVDADGYAVTLDGAARAGEEQTLRFRIERDGQPVAGLEPYLGALGHLVVLREGDLAFLHVHPEPGERAGEIAFAATFPSAGRYALFLQFQTEGRVHTAPLYVEVAP